MRFFFFGSLMDADVAGVVLGRALAPRDLRPAALHGYVRLTVAEESYPALAPRAGGCVRGVLVEGITASDVARMQFFESEEFEPRACTVELDDGSQLEAQVFLARAALRFGDEAWDPVRWLAEEKTHYLALTREWMGEFGEIEAAALERRWSAGRRRQLAAGVAHSGRPDDVKRGKT